MLKLERKISLTFAFLATTIFSLVNKHVTTFDWWAVVVTFAFHKAILK